MDRWTDKKGIILKYAKNVKWLRERFPITSVNSEQWAEQKIKNKHFIQLRLYTLHAALNEIS